MSVSLSVRKAPQQLEIVILQPSFIFHHSSSITRLLSFSACFFSYYKFIQILRSEKMLGSAAGGKWVLHPSYIRDSVDEGKWLEETDYEWGNEDNNFISDKESGEWKLAAAARKWRLNEGGAFDGMKFVLHMPDKKIGSFSRFVIILFLHFSIKKFSFRLIRAGGGDVLNLKVEGRLSYSGNHEATHLLTEPRYVDGNQVDFVSLANIGVPVLMPIYLNAFLTSDKPPALDEFLLPDYKPHWESKKRSRISTDTPTNAYKKSKSIFGNI